MREPTYFVLASLLGGPLHGYGIIERTGELSAGRVRLMVGALYTALDRLTGEGYVNVVGEESVAGRVRRTYGLTKTGRTALQREADRIERAARALDIVVIAGRLRIGGKGRAT